MKKKERQQGFVKGAAILLAALGLVKIVGALFKIPLNSIIGDAGMGYFGTAYTIYNPIFCLATAGFPVAISRMVSERSALGRWGDVKKIQRLALPLFVVMGILGFSIMVFGARPFLQWINHEDINALPAVYALAPAILFSVMGSVYRGYYEGLRNMTPTALSQVLEAMVKLFLGLFLAWYVLAKGLEHYRNSGAILGTTFPSENAVREYLIPYAAAGAILGVTAGSFLSFLFLWGYNRLHHKGVNKQPQAPVSSSTSVSVLKELLRTALPVALGSLTVNLSSLVDTVSLQNCISSIMRMHPEAILEQYGQFLQAADMEQNRVPAALFGCYTNALTLFMLVPALTQAFGVSALPNVTAAWVSRDKRRLQKNIETVLRASLLFTLPAGICLSVLSAPITSLLHFNPITGKILTILGIASIFAAISTPVCSMLQGIGRMDLPVKLMGIGLIIKVTCNWLLTSRPEINVLGAGIGSLACYFFLTFAGLYLLISHAGIELHLIHVVAKPFMASVLCAAAGYAVYKMVFPVADSTAAALLTLGTAGFVWILSVLFLKMFSVSEVQRLPGGQKIAKILENHRWIR